MLVNPNILSRRRYRILATLLVISSVALTACGRPSSSPQVSPPATVASSATDVSPSSGSSGSGAQTTNPSAGSSGTSDQAQPSNPSDGSSGFSGYDWINQLGGDMNAEGNAVANINNPCVIRRDMGDPCP
jgi:hypothetical protein